MNLSARKATARKAAFARRKEAFDGGLGQQGAARLLAYLQPYRGRVLGAYMPIRTEIDPLAVMSEMALHGSVCVPIIQGSGKALSFQEWTPECALLDGSFGVKVPAGGRWLNPEVLIVPLVAFDRRGGRLGYGGGFYDRTLEGLRAARPTFAVGFAFAAQEAQSLPLEPTDQPLDAIVTEAEVIQFA